METWPEREQQAQTPPVANDACYQAPFGNCSSKMAPDGTQSFYSGLKHGDKHVFLTLQAMRLNWKVFLYNQPPDSLDLSSMQLLQHGRPMPEKQGFICCLVDF